MSTNPKDIAEKDPSILRPLFANETPGKRLKDEEPKTYDLNEDPRLEDYHGLDS